MLARTIFLTLALESFSSGFAAAENSSRDSLISCWGDSLTAGTGAPPEADFCRTLGKLLHRPVFNGGVGGQSSAQIRDRMISRAPNLDQGITIIWAGRNNYSQTARVSEDISTMVRSLPAEAKYLILGIVTGDFPDEEPGRRGYLLIQKLNNLLSDRYSDRFLDVQSLFDDITGQRHEGAQIRADRIHLNQAGYSKLASAMAAYIVKHAW